MLPNPIPFLCLHLLSCSHPTWYCWDSSQNNKIGAQCNINLSCFLNSVRKSFSLSHIIPLSGEAFQTCLCFLNLLLQCNAQDRSKEVSHLIYSGWSLFSIIILSLTSLQLLFAFGFIHCCFLLFCLKSDSFPKPNFFLWPWDILPF
jgi:hypothetical protein